MLCLNSEKKSVLLLFLPLQEVYCLMLRCSLRCGDSSRLDELRSVVRNLMNFLNLESNNKAKTLLTELCL